MCVALQRHDSQSLTPNTRTCTSCCETLNPGRTFGHCVPNARCRGPDRGARAHSAHWGVGNRGEVQYGPLTAEQSPLRRRRVGVARQLRQRQQLQHGHVLLLPPIPVHAAGAAPPRAFPAGGTTFIARPQRPGRRAGAGFQEQCCLDRC